MQPLGSQEGHILGRSMGGKELFHHCFIDLPQLKWEATRPYMSRIPSRSTQGVPATPM
jgi:hypothetical protein